MSAIIRGGTSGTDVDSFTTSKSLKVTAVNSSGSELPDSFDVHTAFSGLSALNATQSVSCDGKQTVGFVVTGLGHANNVLTAYFSIDDGTTYVATTVVNATTNNTTYTVTAAGSYIVQTPGAVSKVQLKLTSYTSGTVTGSFTTSEMNPQFLEIGSYVNVLSTVNSSSANLTSGATFTGVYESDIHWQGIIVQFYATQDCTIVVEQSNDGVSAHTSDTWIYRASSTDSSRAFNLVSNYHRVKVTNNGGSTTTGLVLNTYATPNFSSEPRVLTNAGNKRVEIPAKNTYSFATPATTTVGTGVLVQIQGSASKTVRISKISIAPLIGTAAQGIFRVARYSTAASAGTSATVTVGTHDTSAPAVSAVCTHWTATGGTAGSIIGGFIRAVQILVPASATAVQSVILFDQASANNQEAIVLRGTSEYLAVSTASTLTGCQWFIELTEE